MANKEKTANKKHGKVNKKAKVASQKTSEIFLDEPVTTVIFTNPETDLVYVHNFDLYGINQAKPRGFFGRIVDWFKRK